MKESTLKAVIQAQRLCLEGRPLERAFHGLLLNAIGVSGFSHGVIAELIRGVGTLPPVWKPLISLGPGGSRICPEDWYVPSAHEQMELVEIAASGGRPALLQIPVKDGRGELLGCLILADRAREGSTGICEDLLLSVETLAELLGARVHQRKTQELLLSIETHEELLRLAVDGTSEGVWDWDFVTNELYYSESWLSNFGWEQGDPQLQAPFDLVHPEDRSRVTSDLMNHIEGKTLKFEQEYRFRSKQGHYTWVLGRAKVVKRDALGRALRVVGSTYDLSDLKRAQVDLVSAQKSMVESAKFSALGVMAAGIAHEINNPLAIIQAYCEILEIPEKLTPQKIERARNSILRSVERISKIVRGLRKVARDGEGDPFETASVKTLMDEILSFSHERILNKGIEFRMSCPDDVFLRCQPVQLSQVFLNLINNSIDALEGNAERWIEFTASVENGHGVLRFRDSGPGVPESLRAKLFEPFFTTKQVGKGTGLGLSISRSIIQDHGGEIRLDAGDDRTCFVLTLPLAEAQTLQTA